VHVGGGALHPGIKKAATKIPVPAKKLDDRDSAKPESLIDMLI